MINRSFVRTFALLLMLTSLLLTAGCSSQPNPALNLGGIDIEEVFKGQVLRVHQIVGGVNSLSSADAAVKELEIVSLNFDDLIFNSQKLSPEGQTALSVLALKAAPDMEALVTMVKSSPAIGARMGGTMDEILGKLMKLI